MINFASQETVKSIRNKFQFLATLTVFFPVVLDALFKKSVSEIGSDYQVMSWGVVVAILVANYLLIEWLEKKMLVIVARYTEIFITLSIAMYVPVFMVLPMLKESFIPWLYALWIGVGIEGIMLVPALICMLLAANAGYLSVRKESSAP